MRANANHQKGALMQRCKIHVALIASLPFAVSADKKTDIAGYSLSYEDDGNHVVEMVSPVREVAGTPAEITAKAQSCAARSLSNSGASTPTILEGLGGGFRPTAKESLPLIELVDKESGLLVANSVAPYTSGLLSFSARAKVTVQAKEGRFRIVQGDLATARSDGGANYLPVTAVWGTGWEPALKALIAKTEKLAECMAAPAGAAGDW